jgi:murein L,D-transpeptidase YcbB/YkuD
MFKQTVILDKGTHQTTSGKLVNQNHSQRKLYRYFLIIIPFAVILFISTSYQQNIDELNYFDQEYYSPEIIDSMQNFLLSASGPYLTEMESTPAFGFLKEFYAANEYRPLWIHYNGLSKRADNLIYLIEHAREFGLEPLNYRAEEILARSTRLKLAVSQGIAMDFDLEVMLTDAAFRFMINLHTGYIPLDSALYASTWVNELPGILMKGISNGKVIEHILSVEPVFLEYMRLRHASEKFIRTNPLNDQQIAIKYPNKDTLMLNEEIRKGLISLGYLNSENQNNLTEALKKFQRYHGLNPDGKPGANTIEALGKSTMYRYRVLALNLDRLRKKHFSDSSLLYVNIPAYTLKLFSRNSLLDTFRIIVGNPSSPTPLMTGKMERIISNPVWYVPKSIAINEMLPKIKSDSTYLERNGFRILDKNMRLVNTGDLDINALSAQQFDYTFRQNRGTDNSLGQAKFIFTNPHAVYIHDTPGKSLFAKDLRAFSHGCIRIEHPERLAHYILHNINSDTTNFARLMETGRQQEFKVSSALPVHITYVTCEADEEGKLYFYKDIYGIDQEELKKLAPFMGI